MKSSKITIRTKKHVEMLDLTTHIKDLVKQSNVHDGACTLFVPHTTAGITLNENADPAVVSDIIMEMDKIVPVADGYRHSEGNSAAHIKSTLYGPSLTLIIERGDLILGRWQGIYFSEFDGPRKRKVFVKIMKG